MNEENSAEASINCSVAAVDDDVLLCNRLLCFSPWSNKDTLCLTVLNELELFQFL